MVRNLNEKFKYPICGSLRIGEKNEKNIPRKLDYFTVHKDKNTTDDVIKQFNSKYDKPKQLIIKFLTDEPLQIDYLKYGKSGLLCKGDGEKAHFKTDNNDWSECECSENCEHRGIECKLTGRLFFIIKDINIGGLWRLQTQSYNTIQNFLTTLNFLKDMGIDIKQKEFRITTEENKAIVNGKVNKFTTISLRMIENTNETNIAESKEEKNTLPREDKRESSENILPKNDNMEVINNKEDCENYLTLVEIKDVCKGDKTIKQAVFCNMKDELITLLIHPNIQNEVCNWEIASVISPQNIYEKNNCKILKEYKEILIIKKAV